MFMYGASCVGGREQQQDSLYFDGVAISAGGCSGDTCGGEVRAWRRVCAIPSIFAIADGMGGCRAGDVASKLCIETIRDECSQMPKNISSDCVAGIVRGAIAKANRRIVEYGNEHPACRGMGTTLVALAVCKDGCRVFNLGDSRAYLFKDGKLSLLSKKHTEFQRALDLGLLFDERNHLSDAGGLTRYLGQGDSAFLAQASEAYFERRSSFILLCSDGLTNVVEDREIGIAIAGADDPMVCCQELVKRAAYTADSDNVSVLLVKV